MKQIVIETINIYHQKDLIYQTICLLQIKCMSNVNLK